MRESNWNFADELTRHGPNSTQNSLDLEQSRQYCTNLACNHYENFPVLTRFVPADRRQDFANVYAYCRWSDDIGDEVGDPAKSLELFIWWLSDLERCYSDQTPQHPVMIALKSTIQQFNIPIQPFRNLVAAFQRDQTQTRYRDFSDVMSYCECSADPVGRIVLYLCDSFSEERGRLSDKVCTGLQLANFWQDVAIDIGKDRIYLPQDSMVRFGVTESDIVHKKFTPQFAKLLEFEVNRADELLLEGRALAKQLKGRWKIVIGLFAEGGRTVLRKIRRNGYNVFDRRPKLSRGDLAGLVARTMLFLMRPK